MVYTNTTHTHHSAAQTPLDNIIACRSGYLYKHVDHSPLCSAHPCCCASKTGACRWPICPASPPCCPRDAAPHCRWRTICTPANGLSARKWPSAGATRPHRIPNTCRSSAPPGPVSAAWQSSGDRWASWSAIVSNRHRGDIGCYCSQICYHHIYCYQCVLFILLLVLIILHSWRHANFTYMSSPQIVQLLRLVVNIATPNKSQMITTS